MKVIKIIYLVFILCVVGIISCGKDEPSSSSSSSSSTSKQTITSPSFDKFLTTSTTSGFSIRTRFKTGGDKEDNLSATVYWKSYSTKPSKKPSKSDLTKVETMRQYGSATYYKTGPKKGMTESIVFDKSHTGYNGGTYIYYYVKCTNSKGSASSSIDYTIVKR